MKLINSKKYLTDYALSCGYLETNKDYQKPLGVSIEKMSCTYVVSVYDHENKKSLYNDCFDKLTDARKAFNKLLKQYNLKRSIPEVY